MTVTSGRFFGLSTGGLTIGNSLGNSLSDIFGGKYFIVVGSVI